MRTLQDETGGLWYYDDGDPVAGLVKALEKAGWDEVALPRSAIITGEVSDPATETLKTALAGLLLLDQLKGQVRTQMLRSAELAARVFLCVTDAQQLSR